MLFPVVLAVLIFGLSEAFVPSLSVSPNTLDTITEDENVNFNFLLEINGSDFNFTNNVTVINVTSLTTDQIIVVSSTGNLSVDDENENENNKRWNLTVSVKAATFGHGRIAVNVIGIADGSLETLSSVVNIRVARKERVIDLVFLIAVSVITVINNVNMGCVLDLEVVKEVFRKPVGPVVGFLSQFLFMPLASYGISLALLDTSNERLGLFTLGCCPGGASSNFWTLLFRGDVNLSVVMTFVSTIAALGMMPLWLFTLGQEFLDDIHIPYDNLFISLITFVVPVGIGIIIRYWKPKVAKLAEKIIRPYTLLILIFFLPVGIYTNLFLLRRMTWQIIVAGLSVAWGGYVFGAFAAWMFRMKIKQIVAISIETALQNPGIAFVLLKVSLPQPDADLASVSPVAQLFLTGPPMWIAYLIYCLYCRCNRKISEKSSETGSLKTDDKKIEVSTVSEITTSSHL